MAVGRVRFCVQLLLCDRVRRSHTVSHARDLVRAEEQVLGELDRACCPELDCPRQRPGVRVCRHLDGFRLRLVADSDFESGVVVD